MPRGNSSLTPIEPLCAVHGTGFGASLSQVQVAIAGVACTPTSLAEGVLTGSGDTRTLFFTTVPFNLLRIPLAWFLAIHLGLGPAGIWWAINLTTLLKSLLKAGVVARGRRALVVV